MTAKNVPLNCLVASFFYPVVFLTTFFAVPGNAPAKNETREANCRHSKPVTGFVSKGSTTARLSLAGQNDLYHLEAMAGMKPAALKTGRKLILHLAGTDADRYGSIPVQAFDAASGKWLQGAFLASGQAAIGFTKSKAACMDAMRAMERFARQAKTGLWATQGSFWYDAATPEAILQHAGKFAVIEGRVVSVGSRKRRIYLNFGSNWKNDFTAIALRKGSNRYKGDINRLESLKGARLRLRGIVESAGGPLIRLRHDTQLEIIDR